MTLTKRVGNPIKIKVSLMIAVRLTRTRRLTIVLALDRRTAEMLVRAYEWRVHTNQFSCQMPWESHAIAFYSM